MLSRLIICGIYLRSFVGNLLSRLAILGTYLRLFVRKWHIEIMVCCAVLTFIMASLSFFQETHIEKLAKELHKENVISHLKELSRPRVENGILIDEVKISEKANTKTSRTVNSSMKNEQAIGDYFVQIASQRSPEDAQEAYYNISRRFPILQGKQVEFSKTYIEGKGSFYRVRIQAGSRSDANELCSHLKNAGGSCFVSS